MFLKIRLKILKLILFMIVFSKFKFKIEEGGKLVRICDSVSANFY